ncbi:nucleocapsid protein [Menangle virus]|uniref:Nucleocapsid n=1 Tax=Menangle virus TaxID=152219 RepID=Q91MK3_9MONO|nr:nucleocapsid protein [Menangle virus]
MSSVFRAFELFTLEQEQNEHGNDIELPPETLRTNIKVCTLNNQEPQARHDMMCFCLRLIASNSARAAHKTGAILTLLSLPTAMMQNHLRIADRSPDADIERLEIDGFEPGTFRLRANARTPMTNGEVTALNLMAQDLPDTYSNDTPFLNPNTETEQCDEMEQFLNAIYSVLVQVWVTVCKCMTAHDQPTGSDERRLAKYQQQGRLDQRYALQPELRRQIQTCIRSSLTIRQFLTHELQTARKQGAITGKYYAMVGDIGKYIDNAGMSAFFMTMRFALGTKWPPLALAAFSGELLKLKSLMQLYRSLGDRARYMALLEMSEMMEFAPANYPLCYSYAMGIGSVQDPMMRNYTFARPFLNPAYFQLGVETANRQQGSVDKAMAAELGLTEDEKRDMSAAVTRLTTGRGGNQAQELINVMGARQGRDQGRRGNRDYDVVEENEETESDSDNDEEQEIQNRPLPPIPQMPQNIDWEVRLAEIERRNQQMAARDRPQAVVTADVHQEPADARVDEQDMLLDLDM